MKKINIGSIVPALVLFIILGLTGSTLVRAASPATINLGTAGNYVILSKTTITTTGTTAIVGDIGVSPAAATFVTGFNPTADSSNTFSTSALINGKIFASDYSAPTPANLSTAVSDMETAYTDANSRATSVLNPGSGNLAGLTLVAGVYTFDGAGNVIITSDVTLSGSASDIWVFQIPGNLDISSSMKIVLSGGAQASNVFWAVAGTTTIEPGATFEGNILAGPGASTIALQSGAILNGRALGQTAVTLIGNAVTIPSLVTPPVSGPVFIDSNTNGVLDSGEAFFNTIKSAITASITGDTIFVTPGTYTEAGQIVIDKNISIIGSASSTVIIKTDSDTGNSLDTKGWFLVNSGKTLNLSNATLNGTGHKVYQAIRYNGNGIINNVNFTNIAYEQSGPQYNGAGVRTGATSDVSVINSTFTNIGRVGILNEGGVSTISGNRYTGKGAGNWLDYGFEISYGAHATISGNTISGNLGVATVDGSTSSGISIWDDADTRATLTNNILSGNTANLAVAVASGGTDPIVAIGMGNVFTGGIGIDVQNAGANGSPTLTISGITLNANTVGINIPSGMTATNITIHNSSLLSTGTSTNNLSTSTLIATNNWWGNSTGPTNTNNANGTGTLTSNNVTFDPWFTELEMTHLSNQIIVVVPTPTPTPVVTGAISGGGGGGMAVYTGANTQVATAGEVLGASINPATQAQINSIKYQLRGTIVELIGQLQLQVRAMQIEDIKSQLRTLIGQLIVQIQDQIRVMQVSY